MHIAQLSRRSIIGIFNLRHGHLDAVSCVVQLYVCYHDYVCTYVIMNMLTIAYCAIAIWVY